MLQEEGRIECVGEELEKNEMSMTEVGLPRDLKEESLRDHGDIETKQSTNLEKYIPKWLVNTYSKEIQ